LVLIVSNVVDVSVNVISPDSSFITH
jgi:hypothetical protein